MNVRYLSLFMLVIACATPIAPTGGPRDQSPPAMLQTSPKSGTTDFNGDQFIVAFDDYLNRESARSAVSVYPMVREAFKVDFSRRNLIVRFKTELAPNTTHVITIDKQLSDADGNKLTQPLQFAFSTGPNIDSGKARGRLLNYDGSIPNLGALYLKAKSGRSFAYLSQPDTSGMVQFSYLRKAEFQVFYLRDTNRNREVDEGEISFVGSKPQVSIGGDSSAVDLGTIILPLSGDETALRLQEGGALSERLIRLRFSRANQRFPERIPVLGNDDSRRLARYLYSPENDAQVGFYWLDNPIEDESVYQITFENDSLSFDGFPRADTSAQRLVAIVNGDGLDASDSLLVRFSLPITSASIVDSVQLVQGTDLLRGSAVAATRWNELRIVPEEGWVPGVDYEARIWSPATNQWAKHRLIINFEDDYGAIELSGAGQFNSELRNRDKVLLDSRTFSDSTIVQKLLPGKYMLTIYRDENADSVWNPGVWPESPQEPIEVVRNINVQRGFTTSYQIDW